MGYYIYAWLEHGNPRLRVIDVKTGSICLRWDYRTTRPFKFSDKKEIQRLFRDLLLLTCKQENRNVRSFNLLPIHDAHHETNCRIEGPNDHGI